MKRLMKSIFLVAFVMLTVGSTFAQDKGAAREAMKEKMKVLKVSFITNKLDLTEEEAKNFWPVYNKYEEAIKELKPRKEKGEKPDFENMSDAEMEAIIKDKFEREMAVVKLKQSYFEEFKQVLPMAKILKLYKVEHDFKKEILEKYKQRKEGQGPPEGQKPPEGQEH